MKYSTEAQATTARLKSIREYDKTIFLYKIPDIWNTLKPCDILWIWKDWIWIAIEFKHSKSVSDKMNYDKIIKKVQMNQLMTLESYHRAWGYARVACYCEWDNTFIFYDYKTCKMIQPLDIG